MYHGAESRGVLGRGIEAAQRKRAGWASEQIAREIERLPERFSFLPDNERIFGEWQTLVTTHEVKGKRTHDARLAAVMLAHGVTHLLTFNTADFAAFSEIILLDPAALAGA